VLRFLANLFRRPAVRFGLARDRRGSRLRDPRFVSFMAQNNRRSLDTDLQDTLLRGRKLRFVSFMAQSNRRSLDTDLQDTLLRGRKLVRHAVVAAAIAGAAWFALESAQALSIF